MYYTHEQVAKVQEFVKTSKSAAERKRGLALLALSRGKKRQDVADVLDVNVGTVDEWQTQFKRLGIKGIMNKGYSGNHYRLTRQQKGEIKKTIYEKTPKELQLSEKRFWTTKLLKRLIKERFGVVYQSEATYRKLFYSFGFSCHKPGKHNRNQRQQEVERFRVKVKKRSDNTRGWAVWYW